MNLTIFDEYDLRARVSVWIILMAPIIIPLYIISDSIKSLSTTAIILITLIALSNLFIIVIRKAAKDKYDIKHKYVKKYFKDNLNKEITKIILEKLNSINPGIKEILEDIDNDKFDETLDTALKIIKKNVRDNKLVREENIQYGFCRNIYATRIFGRTISLVMICVEIILYQSNMIENISFMVSIIISLMFLILWIFFVESSIVVFSANNYAEALFDAFV